MSTFHKINTILILVGLSLLSACSNTKYHNPTTTSDSSGSKVLATDLKALQSIDTISAKLAQHRAVFVGESHTNYGDHLNQLAIIKGLHKHWGKKTSIGLEMIQQPYQSFLDKYITGEITEAQMLKGTEWYERWKYEFRLYRPIFDYAKQHKIPLVALNIPRELTKRITKVGIKGLTTTERKQLPNTIDRSNKAYENRIKNVFGGHAHTSSKGFDKFLDAQLGWDEGMAFAAAKYLNTRSSKNMVILAGGGHVINYEGIPVRLDRQINAKSAVVLNNSQGDSNTSSGDYLLFSLARRLPPIGRFGIGMENAKNNGVKVTMVAKKSAAQEAGLKKGDVITKLNNQAIKDIFDIKLFTEGTKPGSKVKISIKRHNKIQHLQATLKRKVSSLSSFFRHKK